jgi:hypothetical protein
MPNIQGPVRLAWGETVLSGEQWATTIIVPQVHKP